MIDRLTPQEAAVLARLGAEKAAKERELNASMNAAIRSRLSRSTAQPFEEPHRQNGQPAPAAEAEGEQRPDTGQGNRGSSLPEPPPSMTQFIRAAVAARHETLNDHLRRITEQDASRRRN